MYIGYSAFSIIIFNYHHVDFRGSCLFLGFFFIYLSEAVTGRACTLKADNIKVIELSATNDICLYVSFMFICLYVLFTTLQQYAYSLSLSHSLSLSLSLT